MSLRAFSLNVRGFVSPPIGQALPADALQRKITTGNVVDAMAGTIGVAEIKFLQVHLKVLL